MDLRDYLKLGKAILLSLFLFFTTRVLFVLFNLDYLSHASLDEIFLALLYGLRFDLSTVFIINTPFIILSVLPWQNSFYHFFKNIIFILFNFFFLIINIVDVEFFSFIGKKMTMDIFDIQSDIQDQLPQLVLNYWYLVLLCLTYLILLIRFRPQKAKSIMYIPSYSLMQVWSIGFCIILTTFIAIRGGVQLRSISPKQAYVFSKYELGNIVLNSSYSLLRSINSRKIDRIDFFKTDHEAVAILKDMNKTESRQLNFSGQNIVIIILESFSWEYIEQGYAPNLSKLMQKSLSMREGFANGRRSIEALPSILTGFPSLMGKPLSQSQFQANKFISLPNILKENGYQTSFFHGGKKGTMDFDAYTKSIGIHEYFSKDDYPNQSHYDGNWGIFDHHYLQFFAKKLSTYKEPFFSTIFTLSSHQPYTLPDDFKFMFKEGELAIHKSVRYVDHALAEFLESIESASWYENTLFIITADHTQKMLDKRYLNSLGKYRVPIIFYHPKIDLKKFETDRVAQHADIFPTVIDFLGLQQEKKLLFGTSVLATDNNGFSINYQSDRFLFYKKPYYLTLSGDKIEGFKVDWLSEDSLISIDTNELPRENIEQLKALIQYSTNGLINNNIYELNH